jgi:hypothetical protein
MSHLKSALLAATLLVGAAGLAVAQTTPFYDPAQLPAVQGKVAQYLLGPRGDVDGLLLADGTEVHFNPMLSTALVFSIKPGDAVTIHGLKAKSLPMVAAASITNDATGATVTSTIGRGLHAHHAALEAEGTVKATLHEARGEADGVLLDDGTVVRLPPPEAQRLAAQLAVGQKLFVRGFGIASPLGKVVMARQIGADRTKLTEVALPHWAPPGGRPGMGGPGGMMHGGPRPPAPQAPSAPPANG